MQTKRILLKDIASRLGLTINTVSRALKDKSDISQKTKDIVKQTAYEMGYIPDVVASSLRSGFTKTIGVMFDNISNPYYMIMTELIHRQIKELDYDLMIFTSSGDHARFDIDSFNKIISRRIDGIITFLKPTKDVVYAARSNNIPLVIIGRDGIDVNVDSVDTNDSKGGYMVGNYLVNKGHKKIGYVGVPRDIECSVTRYNGLVKALSEAKIEPDENLAKFMEHGSSSIKEFADELIKSGVTAIFCFNDVIAFEIIVYLNQIGVKIPDDIAIVGYDNIQNELHLPVQLTTISCMKEKVTEAAVNILMNKINNPMMSRINNKTFDVNLIQRTTA